MPNRQARSAVIKGPAVNGLEIGDHPGCAHWHSPLDIVALKFKCCGDYYACYECHRAVAGHAPVRWPAPDFDTQKAVMCRACKHEMTINTYMAANSACPACKASFNPNCAKHWVLYFELP